MPVIAVGERGGGGLVSCSNRGAININSTYIYLFVFSDPSSVIPVYGSSYTCTRLVSFDPIDRWVNRKTRL